MSECHGTSAGVAIAEPRDGDASSARPHVIAIVGPPNSGKSTLFNRLTGLRQKVANFPGVTVEQHTGIAELPDGRAVGIIDLPGLYSLSPQSEDEQVAHDVLTGKRPDTPRPEAFFFLWYADHRDLHSFPTRRSS